MDVTSPSVASQTTNTLRIGHGQVIRYNYKTDVKEFWQFSFAGCITRLVRVWDDERPEWDPMDCGKNLLQINGVPIALRYWHDVFSGQKGSTTWSWLKKQWGEWRSRASSQYVAKSFYSGTPDEFWAEFADKDGNELPWSTVIGQLRASRTQREERLAEQAKAEYGARFSTVFVNNRGKTLTKNHAIARRYLTLKNPST
ncbi:hypothetical protein FB446DRAFT_653227 [Lentinula raphanica]|nr:hypothetical protein FB446DRAFT_653227 [Lentinula raphanica]